MVGYKAGEVPRVSVAVEVRVGWCGWVGGIIYGSHLIHGSGRQVKDVSGDGERGERG